MPGSQFIQAKYGTLSLDVIREDIVDDGWLPALIHDPPGHHYPPHQHATSKLLAFVEGSMEVGAGGRQYSCDPGDRLIIPGSTIHSATAGQNGCTYFWSEQVREID